ncbi:substrate-binding periplasmic protein [Vibrio tapetis]|uniref:ABC-type amino acid transport, signal transduction system, periplasmic component/domain protein n=1 Tax=Vibrio tapetis subsp. tapetis TaxID=1671868 RepID=A0A2N8ZLA0_9VIBR|nr:transporter substrate-binding domain-containing protein [Vibrio tapetis]SON52656.1 ABC-type amino acid transport, signal transduction system, periplasmic component/domain protein [Vibrio tapetis subsp. tapetis]
MRSCFKWVRDGLLGTAVLISFSVLSFNDLTIYTEEFPPYNFTENGELRGITVDLLLEATKRVGKPIEADDIKVHPWARSYRRVQVEPNTMLFSMAHIPSREKLFKWVGPIGQTRVVLLAKKNRGINISEPSQLLNYKIGTIRDDVAQKLVEQSGVDAETIEHTSTTTSLAKMLDLGRIDLWAYEENAALWVMEQSGLDSRDFEPVYVLMELDMYFALNRGTEQSTVDELQKAIEDVMRIKVDTGRSDFQDIFAHYLPEGS